MSVNLEQIRNIIRLEAQRVLDQIALTRIGIVQAYDPNTYSAKVNIQPENVLTGYLPITAAWVGNGWGFLSPPTVGDVVEVNFQEGGKNAGYIGKRFYSSVTQPPSDCPSGELWIIHQTGTFFKLTNDGKALLNSASEIDIGNMNQTVHQLLTDLAMSIYNSHTHPIPEGNTGVPNQQMDSTNLTQILKAN